MNKTSRIYVCFILFSFAQSVVAAWSLEPSVFLRAEKNDNIYLSVPGAEQEVSGGAFSPAIKLKMDEEVQSLIAEVDLLFTRYSDAPELDRDEGKASIDWRTTTESNMLGISTSYTKKSNLDSTLEISGIDEKVEQKIGKIAPSWFYQFYERWNLSLNLSYTDTEYDEPGLPGYGGLRVVNFINSVEQSASLGLAYEVTERDSVSITYYSSTYDGLSNGYQIAGPVCQNSDFNPDACTVAGFPDYDTVGDTIGRANERKLEYNYNVWQLGYEHNFEENNSIGFQVGTSVTTIQNQTRPHYFDDSTRMEIFPAGDWQLLESEKKGQVYNLNYKHKNEISHFDVSVGRDRVAASSGGLDETDTARIYYATNMTERLTWSFDLSAAKYRPDQDTNVGAVYSYKRLTALPVMYYSFDQDWSISVGYIYARKIIEADILERSSSTVFINMSWRVPKLLSTN